MSKYNSLAQGIDSVEVGIRIHLSKLLEIELAQIAKDLPEIAEDEIIEVIHHIFSSYALEHYSDIAAYIKRQRE